MRKEPSASADFIVGDAFSSRTVPYDYERAAFVRLVAGAEGLRDDYAPVDQLETRPD
jgi:3-deoxy-D-arabino-heptulosonate 7-phosphate (DAHP) synthase